MLSRRRVIGIVVLLCALSAIALADQPYMRAAHTDLQQARAQLQAALANKGGHRVKAIEHVNLEKKKFSICHLTFLICH
jgi:hypothetical protein